MIISPPFLNGSVAVKDVLDAGLRPVAAREATTLAPEGNFPVSQSMNWHTGLHLQAPQIGAEFVPVRAIANGTVVFVNQPRARVEDPSDGQAYNPYGSKASWTDNGMVVLEHTTEIGADGSTTTAVTFYSSYMHMSKIDSAVSVGKKIYRKDVLGNAGVIYDQPGQIEFGICCDAVNLKKIIGRTPDWMPLAAPTNDGRTDVVFGKVYVYLPASTKIKTGDPMPTAQVRSAHQGTDALGTPQWVVLDYGYDTGTPGTAVLTTFDTAGARVGACAPEVGAEYKLFDEAITRHGKVPGGGQGSSPSGWYELLRFGRNIGRGTSAADKDALPTDAMHWRKVTTVAGATVWADLNGPGSYKFSDADYLPAMGWNCYDDDRDPADQRCSSDKLKSLIADPLSPDSTNDPAKLAQRIGVADVLAKFSRTICKFPHEWDKATLESRYQFMSERADIKENPASWTLAKKHLNAMGLDALPDDFKKADWHFHPAEFVRILSRCGWLDRTELAQCFPRKHFTLNGTSMVSHSVTWEKAFTQSGKWTTPFNIATRKYGLSNAKQRLVHFFSHVIPETGFLTLMKEGDNAAGTYLSGKAYYPYYGRGLIQLTWKAGYEKYGIFRGFPRNVTTGPYHDLGWNPDTMVALNNTTYNAINCADSACCFVINTPGMLKAIDNGIAQSDAIKVSKFVNGHVAIEKLNGLEVRLQSVLFLRDALLNQPADALTETLTFDWRRNSAQEPTGEFNAQGQPKKKFFLKDPPWAIQVPLNKQRP